MRSAVTDDVQNKKKGITVFGVRHYDSVPEPIMEKKVQYLTHDFKFSEEKIHRK